ncbi:hypothetical protein [Marinactinospora rubrisoli]|uniref:MYXO-CTERM domain-containing protein n=1 Tax=Marinactinospora rubrisoli TaxID=2715399 RepID=A0ABW2KMI9_9ACTN
MTAPPGTGHRAERRSGDAPARRSPRATVLAAGALAALIGAAVADGAAAAALASGLVLLVALRARFRRR